jgi:wobble nucleotide-excising tRNase
MRAMSVLYRVDIDLYSELTERFSDLLVHDLNHYFNYWRAFQSQVGTLSKSVNDAYLKANSQSDGVQSYGRVVDLLIADYKRNNYF